MDRSRLPFSRRAALLLSFFSLSACGSNQELPDTVSKRYGTVVVESCALDPWQTATLQSDSARAVLSEVILLCLYVRNGVAEPLAPADQSSVAQVTSALKQRGYRVRLGVTTGETPGTTPSALEAILADPAKRAALIASLAGFSPISDGIALAPPTLLPTSEASFRAFVNELAATLPDRRIGLFAPPSSMTPSDVASGDAIKLSALSSSLSRSYLMTLDLHCCDDVPGPTTASDWITRVVTFARSQTNTASLSFSLPLYGTYFGATKTQRQVSYAEAAGMAASRHIEILRREDTGSLYFSFSDAGGVSTVVFDDSHSLLRTLSEVDAGVPADVGVLYYGLGGEDPNLFAALKERMK